MIESYTVRNRKVGVLYYYLSIIVALAGFIHAAESESEEVFLSLQDDLLNIDKTADINKQNIDYKPYIVSVLQRDQLEKLGVVNLREALKLIPGVDISVGKMGVTYPVFRGSNPYSVGQSQLYIDGIALSDTIFNAYFQYLDMPIGIIERIEVVRGPGSLLAHEHAYGGSINVITRAADVLNETPETRAFIGASGDNTRLAGGQTLVKTGQWKIGADAYYQESHRHRFDGPDSLGQSREAYFDNETYAIGLNARNGKWDIGGRFTSQVSGPSYGQMFTLSQDPGDYLDIKANTLHAAYTLPIAADTVLKVSGDYLDQQRKLQNKTIPDNTTYKGQYFPYGRYFYVDYAERRLTALAQIENDTWERWHLIGGIKKSVSTVGHDDARMTKPGGTTLAYSDLLFTDRRDITTLYGEATYQPAEATSIAAGFKYDDISDHGKMFSPRISAVHLLDPNNILKAMATRSYRLPSWREEYFYGAPSNYGYVQTEKVDSYELSYIHKTDKDESVRFNLFYLKNRDQVEISSININVATDIYDTTIKGAEFELQRSIGESDDLTFNYSYADGTIDRYRVPIPNSANHMAVLTNIYRFNDKLTTGTILKYVGSKARDRADVREKLDDYVTWDQSLYYKDYERDYSISLSVQNVLNEHYQLPAAIGTYPNDFVQPGRSVWIKFEKSWQ